MEIANNSIPGSLSRIAQEAYSATPLQERFQSKDRAQGLPISAGKTSAGKINADRVTLSDEARRLNNHQVTQQESSVEDKVKTGNLNQARSQTGEPLTDEQQRQLDELQRRDVEVRTHEQAHMSASGGLVQGGASFTYQNGPDGKRYAVGGEVSIDTSKVADDPQANLAKAQKIRRAALAPSQPSSQDRSAAASASRMEAEARAEVAQLARDQQSESSEAEGAENALSGSGSRKNGIRINEKNIQDSYTQIQNTQVLQQQISPVDYFI